MQYHYRSAAKVNLFFRIVNRRADGYHNIASLFHTIDLFDLMTFEKYDELILTCSDKSLSCSQSNLVLKAVHAFEEKTSIPVRMKIHLQKRIPIGGGLGGGSSNCATTLYALNTIYQTRLSKQELMQIGAQIGADVPFFFSIGRAYCTGIGDIFEEVKPLLIKTIWLNTPPIHCDTRLIYQSVDLNQLSELDPRWILEQSLKGEYHFVNDLTPASLRLYPPLKCEQDRMQSSGFKQVVMTGSGSTWIGIDPKSESQVEKMGLYRAQLISRQANTWW